MGRLGREGGVKRINVNVFFNVYNILCMRIRVFFIFESTTVYKSFYISGHSRKFFFFLNLALLRFHRSLLLQA